VVTLKCEGARTLNVHLAPDQEKVVSLLVSASPANERLIVISIACNVVVDFRSLTGGTDFRICGVGVRWFYACREDDVLARLKMIEAISLNDFPRLQRQAPEIDFFLHT
jgi:hypothetical protein